MRMIYLVGLFCVVNNFAQAANLNIAVFDMRRALMTVGEGKKARDVLTREWDDRQKRMQIDAKKIQDAVDALKKQSMVMDENTRRQKEEAIQNMVVKLREAEAKNPQEFQQRDQEISAPILKKLRDLVLKISHERGLNLVLNGDEGAVIFADQGLDITDQVIKLYDSKK